ncbi:MAG: pseudouridylate synthase [Deltaproteobacteria bacterium]|nr:pseudouridylate synthase [Deltaproteobacteria bacterium]
MLFVDDWLAVVAKPSGEVVHPGWARGEATTMTRVRNALRQWVYPVHRLDRGTSGVVVLARDPQTARALADCWHSGSVRKRYVALVRGTPPEQIMVDHAVRRGERGSERVSATTRFRRLAICSHARCSLVEAEPVTGRLHQIRRHLKHLSHPIVGDVHYGDGKVNRAFRAEWDLHRLALHAAAIRLDHPMTGEVLALSAPIPDDLAQPLAALGLAEAAAGGGDTWSRLG